MFQYKPDIQNSKKIILFLPEEQDKFFIILPFAMALSEKRAADDFLIMANENNRHILRALNLERLSLFYNNETMLYGSDDFFELEKKIQEQKWDLCIFLQENAELPYLYLARITRAPYRIGLKPEFPFLNIVLRPASQSDNIYANRKFLYKMFFIDSKQAEEDSIHATLKNEKLDSAGSKLSTSNTILFNLEPPIEGKPWSDAEVLGICKAFQPSWRIITIAATAQQLEPYAKVMEELDMRSNHVLLHSESIFSVLRQYPAIITLNSLHSHLFLNLSNIKVLMLEDLNAELPNNKRMLKFGREGNYYSFSKLATDFLNPNSNPDKKRK